MKAGIITLPLFIHTKHNSVCEGGNDTETNLLMHHVESVGQKGLPKQSPLPMDDSKVNLSV